MNDEYITSTKARELHLKHFVLGIIKERLMLLNYHLDKEDTVLKIYTNILLSHLYPIRTNERFVTAECLLKNKWMI